MRVLYHHRTAGDGAEGIHIKEMVEAFRDIGHDVRVVSLVGEGTKSSDRRRQRWRRLQRLIPSRAYEVAELAYNPVGQRLIARAIDEFRPDFVYDRYNSYSTAAVKAARKNGLPVVLEFNAPAAYERVAYEHLPLAFPRLARSYERWICLNATHLFAVSTPLKDHVCLNYGLPDANITVLPNGANPSRFDPTIDASSVRGRYGLADKTVVGFVGILRPWHGVEMLLEACAPLIRESEALRVLIVGDGPSQAGLEVCAAALGVQDRVIFTGRVSHDDVGAHLAAIDIAVSPRATFYASPMKIVEYMAMAKTVVAPDSANIRDLVRHGDTGILFEPERTASLENALRRIVAAPHERRQLGARARQAVVATLNWHSNARTVCEMVSRVRPASP